MTKLAVWVSSAGNDATCARGSASTPCATLTRAVELAADGDTIELADGAYSPPGPAWTVDSGFGAAICVQPAEGAHPVLRGDLVFGSSVSNVALFGLTVDEVNGTHQGGVISFDDGSANVTLTGFKARSLYFNGASFVTFEDLDVGDTACKEIEFQANGTHNNSNIAFRGGQSHDWRVDATCPGKHTSGMLVEQAEGLTINGMKFFNTGAGEGILVKQCCGSFGAPVGVNILNSWFGNTGGGGAIYFSTGGGATPEDWNQETIAFNTALGAITLETQGATWTGTDVYGNLAAQLSDGAGGCPAAAIGEVDYNVFPGAAPCGGHVVTTGTLSSYLVNSDGAAAMDFHLAGAKGSTAADNLVPGDHCVLASEDFDRQGRPKDALCDAGADER